MISCATSMTVCKYVKTSEMQKHSDNNVKKEIEQLKLNLRY